MSTLKIAKAANLELWGNGACNDTFETFACLVMKRSKHRVRSLPQRNDEHSAVGVQVVQVFANAQHAALARDVSRKCLAHTTLPQRMVEDVPRDFFHGWVDIIRCGCLESMSRPPRASRVVCPQKNDPRSR